LKQSINPGRTNNERRCESNRDYISRELLQHILEDEEEHIDWLETQLELIDKVGLQNYLQSHM